MTYNQRKRIFDTMAFIAWIALILAAAGIIGQTGAW